MKKRGSASYMLWMPRRLKDDFKKACTLQDQSMVDVINRLVANYTNEILTKELKVHEYHYDLER